jgi:hypothetical protein
MSATCQQIDKLYPAGCPSGFSLKQVFYTPNSELPQTYGSGNTPVSDPVNPSCFMYACVDASGNSPIGAAQAKCPPDFLSYGLIAGGIAAFLFLDGWTKLLGIVPIGIGVLNGLATHMQAELQPDGTIKCIRAGTSW